MKNVNAQRSICTGLIDGLTIPLALAAALCRLVDSPGTIVIACITVALAGAITMAAGGYLEGRKYDERSFSLQSSLLIGLSYLSGGLIVAIPFLFSDHKITALMISVTIAAAMLLIAGYVDSVVNNASGWFGAARVSITGICAAAAAYLVAGLF